MNATSAPQNPGAFQSVADSTALAALNVDLTVGTKCYNKSVDADFSLKVSTASLVTDQVVAVEGNDGLRWVKDDTGGSDVTPSLDHFVQLSATSNTLALTGLDGDLEGEYLISGDVTAAAVSAAPWQFMINGTATNLRARKGDTAVGSSYATNWYLANTGVYPFGSGTRFSFTGRLIAKSGRVRILRIDGMTSDSNNDSLFLQGEFTDTGSNITEFSLVTDQPLGFAIGACMKLVPLNTNA